MNNNGETVLHKAVQEGDVQLITVLLKAGANGKLKDHSGKTAQDLALLHSQVDICLHMI